MPQFRSVWLAGLISFCVLLGGAVHTQVWAAPSWSASFAEAQVLASAQGKDMLVFFSAVDQSPWCSKLYKRVLSQESFLSSLGEKFVFVRLEFSKKRQTRANEAEFKHNENLRIQCGLSGFPSLVLFTANELPYAKLGYPSEPTEKFIAQIHSLHKRRELVLGLHAKSVVARMTALQGALPLLRKQNLHGYSSFLAVYKEGLVQDKGGKWGFRVGLQQAKEELECRSLWGAQNWEKLAPHLRKTTHLEGEQWLRPAWICGEKLILAKNYAAALKLIEVYKKRTEIKTKPRVIKTLDRWEKICKRGMGSS